MPVALAISSVLQDAFPLLTRLGIDVLAMLVLVGWLYRRRLAAPEMALVFTALNMGLFVAVASIGTGSFPTGVGFGLFGLLSLVRLRSAAFTLKDVAYTFVALVIALVTALPERSVLIAVFLDVVLLATLWFMDDTRWRTPVTRVIRITLDHAVTGPTEASLAVSRRLDIEPLDVVIEDVDMVRDTTRVAVRVVAPPGSWRPARTEAEETVDAL